MQAKAGDKALIQLGLGGWYNPVSEIAYNGTICQVVGNPELPSFTACLFGAREGSLYNQCLVHDGNGAYLLTACLIPLPPDDVADKLFKETQSPIHAKLLEDTESNTSPRYGVLYE